MERVYREIARDVARVSGAALAQVVVVESDATGSPRSRCAAVEGSAVAAARDALLALFAADPGAGPAEPLLQPAPPPRVVAPCEEGLVRLLGGGRGPEPRSVFHRLGAAPPHVVLLRVVLPGRMGGAALRALDAAARLAAGRLDAEWRRREGATRSAAHRAFLESAGEAILVADAATGRILEGNQKLCELTGRRAGELTRLRLDQLLEHPLLSGASLLGHLASAPVVREEEARLRRRRGEAVPVALTTARIELTGRAVLHVIARDVTRERRALADLREARDTLAGLQGAGAQLMGETDEAGVFGVLARELVRLGYHSGVLGPAPEGGPALAWRFTSLSPPAQRALERSLGGPLGDLRIDPATAPLVRRCLAEGRPVVSDRARPAVRQLFGGGGLEQLRVMGRVLGFRRVILAPLGRPGKPGGVLVVAAPRLRHNDLDAIDAFSQQASIALEKARLVAALREERTRLESEVERRTRELTLAVGALEETGRRRDHFLANVSHELRTPLVTVLGWSELLLGEKLGPLVPRQRAALEVVAASSRRLRGFIDELLELERHELTRGALELKPFEVGGVLNQSIMALAPRYAERGLRLRARVARGTPRVYGDRERILQALVNLLVNAERYSPVGGVVRVAAARVRPGRIEIAVADHGAGIPEEHLPHVFERFYQVRDDRSANHRGGALGLGLAIVKSIVEAHGGTVRVRSRLGRGTTFTLSLPSEEVLDGPAVIPEPIAAER
jgi:PAS domain S-box-containing protein